MKKLNKAQIAPYCVVASLFLILSFTSKNFQSGAKEGVDCRACSEDHESPISE